MAKLACKKCKRLLIGDKCPICGAGKLTKDWKGRVYVVNPEKSELAKKMGIKDAGEFAVRA